MNTIIFVHKGKSYYLELAIAQAKKFNPTSEILLFGDHSNKDIKDVTHHDIRNYFDLASDFDKVFFNNSPNRRSYELFCFQRWFVIRQFMKQNQLYDTDFVYCDSDTLLFTDISHDLQDLSPHIMATESWESPAFTFFKKGALEDFCNMIMWFYTTKEGLDTIIYYINKFEREATGQSISDMTAFMHFTTEWRKGYCLDAQKPSSSWKMNTQNDSTLFCYDHNINIGNGFITDGWGRKKITIINKKPYCTLIGSGKKIMFKGLHFQGDAKYMMIRYQSGCKMSYHLYSEYYKGYAIYRIKILIRNIFKKLGLSLRKI